MSAFSASRKAAVPSVTIAVCAYNEEANIASLLRSVVGQREEGYELREIVVVSDGSTDSTCRLVRDFPGGKIRLVDHPERRGKSSCLNEIFSALETEILVQADADIILAQPYVVRDLVAAMQEDERMGMCSGQATPVFPQTFIERAISRTVAVNDLLKHQTRCGNNAHAVSGCIIALSNRFVRHIRVPEDMIGNDMYLYLRCIELGQRFAFVPTAEVYFRSPQNIRDHLRQQIRFAASYRRYARHFSEQIIHTAFSVPRSYRIKVMLTEFLRHPIECTYIYCINRYCRLMARWNEPNLSPKWKIADSTKRLNI